MIRTRRRDGRARPTRPGRAGRARRDDHRVGAAGPPRLRPRRAAARGEVGGQRVAAAGRSGRHRRHDRDADDARRLRASSTPTTDRPARRPTTRRSIRRDARRTRPTPRTRQEHTSDPTRRDRDHDRPGTGGTAVRVRRAAAVARRDADRAEVVRRPRRVVRAALHRVARLRAEPADAVHRPVSRTCTASPRPTGSASCTTTRDCGGCPRARCRRSATGSGPPATTPTTTASGTSATPT